MTYPLEAFRFALLHARTVADVLRAYKEFASFYGVHAELPEEQWARISAALALGDSIQLPLKEGIHDSNSIPAGD
jgi:hypothetical protein